MSWEIRHYVKDDLSYAGFYAGDPDITPDTKEGVYTRTPFGPDDVNMVWDPVKIEWSFRFDPEGEAETKRVELRKAAADEITGTTFESVALGSAHQYDSRLVDQVNLQTRYTLALINSADEPVYADPGTGFVWLPHSAAQLLAVLTDMNARVKTIQVKLAGKMIEVDAATSRDDLTAISW